MHHASAGLATARCRVEERPNVRDIVESISFEAVRLIVHAGTSITPIRVRREKLSAAHDGLSQNQSPTP